MQQGPKAMQLAVYAMHLHNLHRQIKLKAVFYFLQDSNIAKQKTRDLLTHATSYLKMHTR